MAGYTLRNLGEVEDLAPKHGMEGIEARFARDALELEKSGVSLFRMQPNFRLPFGHTHSEQEEIYVVVSGSARMKVGDEVLDLQRLDALRVAPGVMRGMESGPEGAEMLAFGAPAQSDAKQEMGWWKD